MIPQSISHSESSYQEAADMTDLQFVTESFIQGYYACKSMWGTEIGETFSTKKEHNNPHDRFSVAMMKGELTVGHIPKEISKVCWFFLYKGRTICCTVKDKRRRSSIEQGSLEVPCELTFSIPNRTKDNKTIMSKLRKLLA